MLRSDRERQLSPRITIRAVIPHYFQESDQPVAEIGIGSGFGSRAHGGCFARSLAFSRCLQGLLNLRRAPQDLLLDLRTAKASRTPEPENKDAFISVDLEIIVVVQRGAFLVDVLTAFGPQVQVLQHDLEDPRNLGLTARDWLINHPAPADLNLYLEDDLVIHDSLFAHKILWMAHRSNQRCVLLPHRYELTRRPGVAPRLFIDGPIDHEPFAEWHQPTIAVAHGDFRSDLNVQFDCPINPHAGCFGVTKHQLQIMSQRELPREGFVGPLETAATYTVGRDFMVLKPTWINREFLAIEHGHPSYLGYINPECPPPAFADEP